MAETPTTAAPRVLAYALPDASSELNRRNLELHGLRLDDLAIGTACKFEDYDIIVILAGSFEVIDRTTYDVTYHKELDHRSREFWTAI